MQVREKEVICPGCDQPATRVLQYGWLFRCDACDWEWGHPQAMNRVQAQDTLFEAKRMTAN
jgi:ribosomal protein L37AE/L43A